jgi:hypothetical protein
MSKENKKGINQETNGKKSIIRKIIKIIIILIVGFIVICALPYIYFVLVVLYSMFIDIPSKPKVKHGEFPFELVYEYKGEQTTIKDTIVCDYDGYSWSLEGGNSRDWICEFGKDDGYGIYYIDKENEPTLYIEVPEAPDYYMGDKEFNKEYSKPIIRYIDGYLETNYEEKEKIDVVDIKIIEWKPSKPLKNNIK